MIMKEIKISFNRKLGFMVPLGTIFVNVEVQNTYQPDEYIKNNSLTSVLHNNLSNIQDNILTEWTFWNKITSHSFGQPVVAPACSCPDQCSGYSFQHFGQVCSHEVCVGLALVQEPGLALVQNVPILVPRDRGSCKSLRLS